MEYGETICLSRRMWRWIMESIAKVIDLQKNCISLYPIKSDELHGKAVFQIPLIGYIKLIVVDDLGKILTGQELQYFP